MLSTRQGSSFGMSKIEIQVKRKADLNNTADTFLSGVDPYEPNSKYSRLSNQHELLNTSQESLITNLKIKNSRGVAVHMQALSTAQQRNMKIDDNLAQQHHNYIQN